MHIPFFSSYPRFPFLLLLVSIESSIEEPTDMKFDTESYVPDLLACEYKCGIFYCNRIFYMLIEYLHSMSEGICPICGSRNVSNLIDLGKQPLANELVPDLSSSLSAEKYELALNICSDCLYVWLRKQVPPEKLFRHNTYLTGISKETQLDMNNFADSCIEACYFEKPEKVIDIGSNDGTLLSFFNNTGFEVLGIDPSRPAYERAKSRGIPTINDFFGDKAADEALTSLGKVDIITGTNVITHVNDPISFLRN